MASQVIDTNVLIVSSGEHPGSPFSSKKHPVEDPEEAGKVLAWLVDLESSDGKIVLDNDFEILKEYHNKLCPEQDYGLRVIFGKMSADNVEYVKLNWVDDPAHTSKVASLEEPLKTVIQDLADTKMVAACIEANKLTLGANIVNACDTDWYDWEEDLTNAGVKVEQLIEDWSRQKWKDHHGR